MGGSRGGHWAGRKEKHEEMDFSSSFFPPLISLPNLSSFLPLTACATFSWACPNVQIKKEARKETVFGYQENLKQSKFLGKKVRVFTKKTLCGNFKTNRWTIILSMLRKQTGCPQNFLRAQDHFPFTEPFFPSSTTLCRRVFGSGTNCSPSRACTDGRRRAFSSTRQKNGKGISSLLSLFLS